MNRPFWNLEPCGTDAAYRRHYRHGQKPCERCLHAHNMALDMRGSRERYNARRRELYAQARAAGASSREASHSREAGATGE